jgi:ribosome-binding protein aMBF1 (putative translation factor)
MKRKGNRFGQGGCYACLACGKKTRDTGHDEAGVQLCRKCYDEAGEENRRADGLSTPSTEGGR